MSSQLDKVGALRWCVRAVVTSIVGTKQFFGDIFGIHWNEPKRKQNENQNENTTENKDFESGLLWFVCGIRFSTIQIADIGICCEKTDEKKRCDLHSISNKNTHLISFEKQPILYTKTSNQFEKYPCFSG